MKKLILSLAIILAFILATPIISSAGDSHHGYRHYGGYGGGHYGGYGHHYYPQFFFQGSYYPSYYSYDPYYYSHGYQPYVYPYLNFGFVIR
ncbi:MAG: hypothetical protein ACRENT_02210 [Thermodesulfobacteriota bacterium]